MFGSTPRRMIVRAAIVIASLVASLHTLAAPAAAGPQSGQGSVPIGALGSELKVGDAVFVRVTARPFMEVSAATQSWSNHVGIVVDTSGDEALIGESTFPLSRITTLSRFVARSEDGRVAVSRLAMPLTPEQERGIASAAQRRSGIFYDTGFNLHSGRQFCSRFVREVLQEAAGVVVGEVETFANLFAANPQANLGFWKFWYFGRIPWERETVTPASLLRSVELNVVFDGTAIADAAP